MTSSGAAAIYVKENEFYSLLMVLKREGVCQKGYFLQVPVLDMVVNVFTVKVDCHSSC
jgi:hypothetical protein